MRLAGLLTLSISLVSWVPVLLPAPALAADKPIVTVLYFDNQTGDETMAPLGKGLADMMITDLSALPQIRVVEREKLEALLRELALQQTEYFDPVTAQHIGQTLVVA